MLKKTILRISTCAGIISILSLLLVFSPEVIAQDKVILQEKSVVLPTYKVEPAERAPIFFTGGSFQGARRVVYPYAQNDVISNTKEDQAWKFLTLENEYIKLGITPEIGGKLYYATDKTANYNFIYKNNEVKPSNIGMLGAWVSGGIEWCVFHHHRASTMYPMDYSMTENADGSKTIFIGETEPRHRMRWTVGITVRPGRSYFEADLSIYNPTPYTNTFLYWANVATHTNENYQVIFPPSVEFATYHSKTEFTHWPISTEMYLGQDFSDGVDISWWKNVKQSASFFAYDLKEDFMGGYDHGSNTGTVHIGDHNIVKGAKLWEWGSGIRGQATEGRLTETSGPYVEIMVGAFSDNQPDYTWIKPYEVKKWKQYWYPVKDIEGFKNANLDAAVNLEPRDSNRVFLGYYSTQKLEKARIILKKGSEIVFQEEVQISPVKAFTAKVKINGDYKLTDLYTEMVDAATNQVLISYQPVETKRAEKLPEVVDAPPLPKDIKTIEELYIVGSRNEQFYKSSKEYYEEALKRDPGDIRTNIAMGNQFLKNGDYPTARSYFARAIKRLTQDYTRPSTCEALFLQGLTLKAMGLYDEGIDTLYRATWDYAWHSAAYFELAQISGIKGDYAKALEQINESLLTNMKNNRAIGLKAAIQRKSGDAKGAIETFGNILETDPLNFRIGNEAYLIAKELGNSEAANKALISLTKKMRDFDQNYLELAVEYINDGMPGEAEDVLLRHKGENPIVQYYLGYLQDKNGKKEQAAKYFKIAQSLSVDYSFPFRLETVNVLKTAIAYNEKDGKAYYYLGNILYDKQPEVAIGYWEKAIEFEPDLALAYRNLGWGYYRHFNDFPKAIPYYEKAISIDHSDAILFTELDDLYELNNSPIETRLKLFEGNEAVVNKRDDAFVRQITVLTLAGKPEKSVEYLSNKTFSYREGNSRVREVIIDAQLSLGLKYMAASDYQKALDHFLLAQVPDEEAGSARSGNRDIQVNYFIGQAYEALNKGIEANDFYSQATAAETSKRPGIMSYYQGLCFLKLNDKAKAKEIFESLIEYGNEVINKSGKKQDDFFAIFGEKDAENKRNSQAYTLRGLGYKGLGKTKQAKYDLQKAVDLSVSNLWAGTEIKGL
jgi:tetratricopeptide (TPR) repeat protein